MKSKYLMIGAAFFAALFLFSGVMLCRQYMDEKQRAEAFDNIAALVQDETSPADEPQESEPPRSPNKPTLKSTLRSMSRTAILWAGFPLREQTSTIPLCRFCGGFRRLYLPMQGACFI